MLHTSRTPNNRNKHRTPWQTHTWITPKGKAREAAAAGAGGGRRQHAYRNAVHTPAPSVDISRIDGPVNCPLGFECPPFDSPTSMRSDFDEAGLDDVSAALGALHLPGDENANIGNAACYHRRRDEAKVAHDCPVVQEGSYDDDASSSSSMPEESVDDLEPLSDEVMAQLQRCVHGDLFEVYDELVSSSVPNCERTYEEDMAELEELENAHCEIEDSAAEELRDTFAYYLELERMFVEAKHEENNDYSRMMTRFTPLKPESEGPNNSPGQPSDLLITVDILLVPMSVAADSNLQPHDVSRRDRPLALRDRIGDIFQKEIVIPVQKRRYLKEMKQDFLENRKNILCLRMASDMHKMEIARLKQKAKSKEDALVKAEETTEEDISIFGTFLESNDTRGQEAAALSDATTAMKNEKIEKVTEKWNEICDNIEKALEPEVQRLREEWEKKQKTKNRNRRGNSMKEQETAKQAGEHELVQVGPLRLAAP
ncbi:Solute carrier 35 [Perkinsus chesapeaki]|uniref:Solute carrier 35 n=1 Tax=Perkinsus chesapeaki TaxID=330153 RepID=A0A7J6LK02_PERCH|nr:Solute carrier 35 [Perkinsus chesapeaki]